MSNSLRSFLFVVVGVFVGLWLGKSESGQSLVSSIEDSAASIKRSAMEAVVEGAGLGARELVLAENPSLIPRIAEGGSFGGDYSINVAQNMFSRHHQEAIEDAREITRIEAIAPRNVADSNAHR